MAATRLLTTGSATTNSGATVFSALATGGYNAVGTEANRQIPFRTAGVLSRLTVFKGAGNRTGMVQRVRVNGANGNGLVSFTSTNGLYEDLTGTDTIAAGDAVATSAEGGTSGSTSLNTTAVAADWAATGTTMTKLFGASQIGLSASSTVYTAPANTDDVETATQADAEWLVKLPPGVSSVTLKNLYVKNTNGAGSNWTVSVEGATGAGTKPSITQSASGTYEDTTNSILALDGDKISVKIVTGTGAVPSLQQIALEVVSSDGVSFLIAASSAAPSIATNTYRPLGGRVGQSSTTESSAQITAGAMSGQVLSLLSVYVKTAGTGSAYALRKDVISSSGGAAGLPAQMKVNTTSTGWTTDTVNSHVVSSVSERLNYSAVFGSAAANATCVVVTIQEQEEPTMFAPATRLITSTANITPTAGLTTMVCAAVGGGTTSTTEGTRETIYRAGGRLSNLAIRKSAGDRAGMAGAIRVGREKGNSRVAFTSTNGIYEDKTNFDVVLPGQAVSFMAEGGTGGSANLNCTICAADWEAEGSNAVTYLAGVGLSALNASTTEYTAPSGSGVKVPTQANAEWLVKLPDGVDSVTLKNLFVRASGAAANTVTVSVEGATGTGTKPQVSFTALGDHADVTNSIEALDGDRISLKIVTGASTQASVPFVQLEVESADGVSFLINASPTPVAPATTGNRALAGDLALGSATESAVQITAGALSGQKMSLLSVYVTTAGTGSAIGLRGEGGNGGAAGLPAQVKVNTTSTGWVTDATNSYKVADADELLNTTSAFGSAAASLTCMALTVSPAVDTLRFAGTGAIAISPDNATASMDLSPAFYAHARPGDVLFCWCAFDSGNDTGNSITASAGWTDVTPGSWYFEDAEAKLISKVFWHVYQLGDVAPTITFAGGDTGTAGATAIARITGFRDADTDDPIGELGENASGGSDTNTIALGGILDVLEPRRLVVAFGAKRDDFSGGGVAVSGDLGLWQVFVNNAVNSAGDAHMQVQIGGNADVNGDSLADPTDAPVTIGPKTTTHGTPLGTATVSAGRMFAVRELPGLSVNITVEPSSDRISRESGKDSLVFEFTVPVDFQAYQVRAVPGDTSPVTAGTLVESGGAGTAGVPVEVTLTDDELIDGAGLTEGDHVFKVFAQDSSGNWST